MSGMNFVTDTRQSPNASQEANSLEILNNYMKQYTNG